MFDVFKKWLDQVENESGRKLKCLKSDNEGEYCNDRFKEFSKSRGIRSVETVPGNFRQNGVAEHIDKIILERARSMQIHGGLSKHFWVDVVNTTVYLINRGPSVPLRILEES